MSNKDNNTTLLNINFSNTNLENNDNQNEDEIKSTNQLIDELTFGCSTESFKKPKINLINQVRGDNNDNYNVNESEVLEISEDIKDLKKIGNILNNKIENNDNNINNNINNINNTDDSKQNYNQLNSINSITNDIKENRKYIFINTSKNDTGDKNNEIISINSTKKDIVSSSMNSSVLRQDNESISQSLLHIIYGNKKNDRNELTSINSFSNYNGDKSSINDNEKISQSLINLLNNRNDLYSKKSNGFDENENNLEKIFQDFNIQLKMNKIDNKILHSGFVNLYDSGSKEKNIKHVNIDKQKNYSDTFEKLYIYENRGLINNNDTIKKKLKTKKITDDVKYYDITMNNNNKINKKVHHSKVFSQNKKSNSNYSK